jgi:hypothetical protein
MWWNFIARNHSEIVEMREAWNARGSQDEAAKQSSMAAFGPEFPDNIGGWIPAPELPNVELRSR